MRFLHDYTCEDCGCKSKMLEVHHNYYVRDKYLWEYDDDLLMCLCEDCHEFRQGREEALYVVLGRLMRRVQIDRLEDSVWDSLHDYFHELLMPRISTELKPEDRVREASK